jgi:hypothetical protein
MLLLLLIRCFEPSLSMLLLLLHLVLLLLVRRKISPLTGHGWKHGLERAVMMV